MRTQPTRMQRRGFTLVELLIVMLLASIIVVATYMMFSSSSEAFHHQELISEVNNSLRFAAQQLHHDLSRAGFQSTAHSGQDPFVCDSITPPILGVQVDRSATPQNCGGGGPYLSQSLAVVGDMSDMPPFPLFSISGGSLIVSSDVRVPLPPESRLESGLLMLDAAMVQPSADLVAANFIENDWLRMVNPKGRSHFSRITGVSGMNITVSPPFVTSSSDGVCGFSLAAGESHEINPIRAVRYEIVCNSAIDQDRTDLVRCQVDPRDPFSGDGSNCVVVAEYVTALSFFLGSDTLENLDVMVDLDPSTEESFTTNVPFYVLYRIEARTRRAVPRRLSVSTSDLLPQPGAPRAYYDLGAGIAELRSVQGRVELTNNILGALP